MCEGVRWGWGGRCRAGHGLARTPWSLPYFLTSAVCSSLVKENELHEDRGKLFFFFGFAASEKLQTFKKYY